MKGNKMIGHQIASLNNSQLLLNTGSHHLRSESGENALLAKSNGETGTLKLSDTPDLKSDRSEKHRRRNSSRGDREISYIVKRAQQFMGALHNLGQRHVVITDKMLGIMFNGNTGQSHGYNPSPVGGDVMGTANSDMMEIRTRALQEVQLGSGDDIATVFERKVERVRGPAGDDAIAVVARNAGWIQGDNGDDAIAVLARNVGLVDGGNGDDAIAVTARNIGGISGGTGEDSIIATAKNIEYRI